MDEFADRCGHEEAGARARFGLGCSGRWQLRQVCACVQAVILAALTRRRSARVEPAADFLKLSGDLHQYGPGDLRPDVLQFHGADCWAPCICSVSSPPSSQSGPIAPLRCPEPARRTSSRQAGGRQVRRRSAGLRCPKPGRPHPGRSWYAAKSSARRPARASDRDRPQPGPSCHGGAEWRRRMRRHR